MIEFPCLCGYHFSVPPEAAGACVKCPVCQRVNEIPRADAPTDTATPEGGYIVQEPEPKPASSSLRVLIDTFSRDRLDSQGHEKDLRPTFVDILHAGVLKDAEPSPAKPVYDLNTGEVTLPLMVAQPGVNPEAPPPNIAFRRSAYRVEPPIGPMRVLREMFRAHNLVVIVSIYLMQLIVESLCWTTEIWNPLARFMMAPSALFIMLVLAHFGCVIDEAGPEGRDELARPMRFVGVIEDIWMPFLRVSGSAILCYFPAWLLMSQGPYHELTTAGTIVLAAVGTFLFPSVLLTMICSGTALNLRPDRVLGVVHTCGARYLWILGLWLIAMTGYGGGIMAFQYVGEHFGSPLAWIVALIWTLAGVFAMHYFCWNLGLIYREFYRRFPWVYQQFMPYNSDEVAGPLEGPRLVAHERLDTLLSRRRFFGPR